MMNKKDFIKEHIDQLLMGAMLAIQELEDNTDVDYVAGIEWKVADALSTLREMD